MTRFLGTSMGLLAGLVLVLAAPQPAYAHGGIDPGQNIWLAWNPTPEIVLGTLLVAWLYVRGLRRWHRPHHPVHTWQRVTFFLGLGAIFLALQSPIDPLAEHVFVMHQVQHLLLRVVGPVLLMLGAPMTPFLRGLPASARLGLVRPAVRNVAARRVYHWLTGPVVSAVLFIFTLYFWQVPVFHDASIRNDGLHYLMHVTMLASGLFFWWVIIDPKPHRSRLHYGVRALVIFLVTLPNTALAALITYSTSVLYVSYDELGRLWGLSGNQDEQLGGLVLWLGGDFLNLAVLAVVFFTWTAESQRRQREQDAKDIAELEG